MHIKTLGAVVMFFGLYVPQAHSVSFPHALFKDTRSVCMIAGGTLAAATTIGGFFLSRHINKKNQEQCKDLEISTKELSLLLQFEKLDVNALSPDDSTKRKALPSEDCLKVWRQILDKNSVLAEGLQKIRLNRAPIPQDLERSFTDLFKMCLDKSEDGGTWDLSRIYADVCTIKEHSWYQDCVKNLQEEEDKDQIHLKELKKSKYDAFSKEIGLIAAGYVLSGLSMVYGFYAPRA